MAQAQPWNFTQLTGPKKKLVLSGWSAPFGRPRQKPVVKDGIKARTKVTRYPDGSEAPTRHIFGVQNDDWEINGRFMDRELGQFGAMAKVQEVKDFVRDLQQVQIAWGDFFSFEGFIEEFVPGRESEAEVAWTMKIQVDIDNRAGQRPVIANDRDPLYYASSILNNIGALSLALPQEPLPPIKLSLLDLLDDAVSVVTGAIGSLVTVARNIGSIASATTAEVQRLQAGVGQVRTLSAQIHELYDRTAVDNDTVRRTAAGDIATARAYARAEAALNAMFADLASLDRLSRIALRGRSSKSYQARAGDTWEKIAIGQLGSPAKADALRQANGVQFGALPTPGQTYIIPAGA